MRTSLCDKHKYEPKNSQKFSRPENIEEGKIFYEIRINKKSRIHGFFADDIFFLVWLDKDHKCFPQ